MCRIAGVINSNLSENEINAALQRMCNVMHKGGPDGYGYYTDKEWGFGHRRLSLIDLSEKGLQPMFYHNRDLCITFNGEIYNYTELKSNLLNEGFHFSSETDTEVILAGYEAQGAAFFKQLKGMFAFALHDNRINTTFLVRDPQGIKPLYYHVNENELIFASEVKAFKAYNNWKANKDWPIYFLAFGFIPEPFTTLADVYSLGKGQCLTWHHQTKKYHIDQYTPNYPDTEQATTEKAIDQTKVLLNRSVQQHLIADAPIGVFLSGGIDSSLLAIVASELHPNAINTVSINFNETNFSEQVFQQIVAEQINSNHTKHTVTPEEFNRYFDQVLQDMDQPSNDGINSWFVSMAAKKTGLKAVLSGVGADELFGGYPSFKRHRLITRLKSLPKGLLKCAQYLPFDKLKRIAYLAYTNPVGEYLFLRGFYTPDMIGKILGIKTGEIHKLLEAYPLNKEVLAQEQEDRISWFETNLYMQNQLLKDTDYMSMAHGIEIRVPFLDQNLIRFLQSLPTKVRFKEQPKHLLINAYKNKLPVSIWDRPKKGFTFPFQYWFKQNTVITDAKIYNNNTQALKLVTQFKNGKLHWSKLFALYQVFKNTA